jgi:2-desacetyl-2-hydroxyethyl bacteriochlorophyllide A dehydrogenase
MKALVYTGPHQAEVAERPAPRPGPGEVLLTMRTVGICHSDLTFLAGDYILPFSWPVVPGPEWIGEVVELGEGVTRFAVGDRVVGECAVTDTSHFGFTMDGALAERFVASADWLHRVPDALDDTMGALVEPFTIGYRAVQDIDASDTVVILGAGPIGLCAVAAAAAKGSRVIVVEPDASRHAIATQFGAEEILDPITEDAPARIHELTDGRGADVVVEGSGNPNAMASALDMACFGGRVVYVGINVGAVAQAPLGRFVEKALRVQGNVGSLGVWPAALRFLERTKLDLSPLVSARFPLSRATEALEAAEDRRANIKVHIHAE